MATITTDTFLDDGVLRTAGEVWTMNGGILTIRTDTRVHIGAPNGMAGSIANTTTSATLGGGVIIDSTAVRWMPFDTGSGLVPALGTIITQGGISGYLLGVWSSYTLAPSTPTTAMPVTGYLKFREVTGGAFAVGALTGIGASATTADRQGWIEVVQRQAAANVVPRLGFFRTRGGWFELDQVTSGSANDTIQIPTNGGGAGTHVAGLWIETGVGTGVYELYPAVLSTWFLAANLDTDQRNKFVQTLGSGQVRIGWDGAANAGFVPPAGCKIRIPSNIGRQSTLAGGDSVNQVPNATLATRPDFTTTSAGDIDFEFFINDWFHFFSAPFRVKIVNSATFDAHSTANEASPTELTNYGCGAFIAGQTLTLTSNPLGGTLTDCRFVRPDAASNGHSVAIATSANYTFTRVRTGVITYARSSGSVSINQCRNIILNELTTYQTTVLFSTCFNIAVTDLNYIDRLRGVTNATGGKFAVQFTNSCDNITVDGVILSFVGDLGPFLGVFSAQNSSNITCRNLGTRLNPVNVNPAFAPAYIFQDFGNNDGIRVQRCYLQSTRLSNFLTVNTSKNLTLESTSGTVGSVQTLSLNTLLKGIRTASNSITGGGSVYGSHTFDLFESDTVGRIWWAMNEPTAFSNSFVTLTLAGSRGGFTSGGQVAMPTVNDVLIIETPYYILGHTAFANFAATLTGTNTGNFTYEYGLDVNNGAGFSAYQTLNAANLSAETISPSVGFKIRLRITTATASTTNALTYVRINTVSTAVAQDNLYPLETAAATLTLTGLEVGTTVALFNDNYTVELDREVIVGTTYTYPYNWDSTTGNFNVRALIWKNDKIPFISAITLGQTSQSIPLNQSPDLVYNAVYTNTHTIDFINELIILDSAVYNVPQVYSLWKDQMLLTTNAQYNFAFTQVGGNTTSGSNSIPFYTFLSNGWKIRPIEASGTTNVIAGILLTDDTSDPFVNTLGAFTVRINYQQPVQAIAVSTTGGGATALEVWTYSARALTAGGVSDIQAGLAVLDEYTTRLVTIQADLDNPSQYQANVSGLATEANATINKDAVILAIGTADPWSTDISTYNTVDTAGKILKDAKSKAALAAALSA